MGDMIVGVQEIAKSADGINDPHNHRALGRVARAYEPLPARSSF
jgi:hypothetical protein